MSAMIGFAVGFVVGIGATMIALVVIDDWKDEKQNERKGVMPVYRPERDKASINSDLVQSRPFGGE